MIYGANVPACRHSGLASRRVPLPPRQIGGTQLVLRLALTGSAAKRPGKGAFANQTCDYGGLEGDARGEIWSMRCPLAQGVFVSGSKKNETTH